MSYSLDFPFAYGRPQARALFRTQLEDFQVDEQLGFEPCGEGEHVYLHIRKRGENTDWVARQIARQVGVKPMDVGYCGLKDRRAVSTQWFSVYLPGKFSPREQPDWHRLISECSATNSIELLQVSRHGKKLRRGDHQGNAFAILLRQTSVPPSQLAGRLDRVREQGVPNYFGEQRFGRDAGNLESADVLFSKRRKIRNRQERGLVLSAARSYLFNLVLGARVERNQWREPLAGDVRVSEFPSGPLWGRGRSPVTDAAQMLEEEVLQAWQQWRDGLEHVGLSQERRSLVLQPQEMSWSCQGEDLEVRFILAPGCFATAVLRELCELRMENSLVEPFG